MNDSLQAKLADVRGVRLTDTQQLYGRGEPLPVLLVNTPQLYAVIALQGAQLLEFRPQGDTPWLWLSPQAGFQVGQAIRGGIPLCLPWFGVNQQSPHLAKHGFVRNAVWQLEQITAGHDGVKLLWRYAYKGESVDIFAHSFSVQMEMLLGETVQLQLHVTNTGSTNMPVSWAWHSYLAVDDLANSSVSGLDGVMYLDNTRGLLRTLQAGAVVFAAEVDSVYEATTQPQRLECAQPLMIEGAQCPSCIVWNPAAVQTLQLPDIEEHYRQFVCVERGAAFADSFVLAPSQHFASSMTLRRA